MEKPADVLPRRQRATVTALIVLAVLAVCAAARIAAPFLIPVVGILASYSLKPFVASLERIHVPRALGSLLVLLVLTGLVAFGISLLRDDAVNALAELPNAAR